MVRELTSARKAFQSLRKPGSALELYYTLLRHTVTSFNALALGRVEQGVSKLPSAGDAANTVMPWSCGFARAYMLL